MHAPVSDQVGVRVEANSPAACAGEAQSARAAMDTAEFIELHDFGHGTRAPVANSRKVEEPSVALGAGIGQGLPYGTAGVVAGLDNSERAGGGGTQAHRAPLRVGGGLWGIPATD